MDSQNDLYIVNNQTEKLIQEDQYKSSNDEKEDNKNYTFLNSSYFPFIEFDEQQQTISIEETLYLQYSQLKSKKIEMNISIKNSYIELFKQDNDEKQVLIQIKWEDFLGCDFIEVKGKPYYKFTLYTFQKYEKQCGQDENRYISNLEFFHPDKQKLELLQIILQNYARNKNYIKDNQENIQQQKLINLQDKVLVFINPAGGNGKSKQKYQQIEHLFQKSGLQTKIIITERQNHAKEIVNCKNYYYYYQLHIKNQTFYQKEMSQNELLQYKGIVTVSGDGLPHEIINGLCSRQDKEQILPFISLGVLPGGSGNALIASILYEIQEPRTLECAAYMICKGNIKKMDMIIFQTKENPQIYSFLSFTWAYISDIDLNSESLRFLAGLRFEVFGIIRAMCQKKYQGKLYFTTQEIIQLPSLEESLENQENWEIYETNFKYFTIMNTPLISRDCICAPDCKIDDGFMDLQYVREEEGWSEFVKYLLSFQSGKHFTKKGEPNKIKFFHKKIKAFRLETNSGLFSIDGEVYQTGNIQGIILNNQLNVFSL